MQHRESTTRGFRRTDELGYDDLTLRMRAEYKAQDTIDVFEKEIESLGDNLIQSPIERAILAALRFSHDWHPSVRGEVEIRMPEADSLKRFNGVAVLLTPQKPVLKYLLDLEIRIISYDWMKKIDVECGGLKYHYKDESQYLHDRIRNYRVSREGYDIVRLSGSQINANPFWEAEKIVQYCNSYIDEYLMGIGAISLRASHPSSAH